MIFWTLLSFSCFSREFIIHINENVSFHHVMYFVIKFIYLAMGIYTVNALSQHLLCLFLKRSQFFLSFILYLNIFVSVKTIATTRLVIYYFIHCYHQLHSSDSPNSTYHWHVPRKWMGALLLQLLFHIFWLTRKYIIP